MPAVAKKKPVASQMQIVECEQGSDEWFLARLGLPTASNFSTVLAQGKGGGESKTRQTLLYKLAGERITGKPAESFSNEHMERGKAMEQEAREFYAFTQGVEVEQVGFIRNDIAGCSPDSLIATDGGLEIKTALPHILIDLLKKDQVPPEHMAQLQGFLWVSEREWVDIFVYWPGMPKLVKRCYRDAAYIENLRKQVNVFSYELDQLVAWLKQRA